MTLELQAGVPAGSHDGDGKVAPYPPEKPTLLFAMFLRLGVRGRHWFLQGAANAWLGPRDPPLLGLTTRKFRGSITQRLIHAVSQ